jgi:hypothetical protein
MMKTAQKLALWRGSQQTADAVRKIIAERYGEEEAKNYDPQVNCFTYQTWRQLGFYVKKGEKAIRSMTLVEVPEQDQKGKEPEVHKYPKTVYLFYIKQVEKKE